MMDQTRYKAWRSGPEAELHVIVYEGAELPFGISSLGPWLGSREGEVANMKPHYRAMLEDTGFVVGIGRRSTFIAREQILPFDKMVFGLVDPHDRGVRIFRVDKYVDRYPGFSSPGSAARAGP